MLSSPRRPSGSILASVGVAGLLLAGCATDSYTPYYGPSQGSAYSSGYGYQPGGYYAPRPTYRPAGYGYAAPYAPYPSGPSITFNLPAGTVP